VRLETTSSRIIDSRELVSEELVTNTEGVKRIRSTDEIDDLPFSPQTVIVNYYTATSATGSKFPMGAHRDDLESAIKSPVVSVSLGCACVFLLEKESDPTSEPTALVLRSGDALLLSGKSRLSLHGVSVVFKKCEPGECTLEESEEEGYCTRCGSLDLFGRESSDVNIDALKRYIKDHRINVNARQVD
jgi:alkylated DNA repair protein alkB family protein 1